jgi:YD repeat-containing protein
MKRFFLITLTVITLSAFGQETGTYQSDSIYKANKVKARLWYSGTNKQLGITTFYDTDGRLIKYQLEPFMDGAQRTTHYTYDSNGRLIAMVGYLAGILVQVKIRIFNFNRVEII